MTDLTPEQRQTILDARLHGSYRCDENLLRAIQQVVDAHVDEAMAGGVMVWLSKDRAEQRRLGAKEALAAAAREARQSTP